MFVLAFAGVALVGCDDPGTSASAPALVSLEYWEDGGTTCVTFEDAGRHVNFCFDGRLTTKTPAQIFMGYPGKSEAVPRNSAREAELLELAFRYLRSKYTDEQLTELAGETVGLLSEDKQNDLRLLRAATNCEQR